MTSTTFCAILAMFIVSLIGQVQTLYTISVVLLIGLLSDFVFTWAFNAGALRLYLAKINPKAKYRKEKAPAADNAQPSEEKQPAKTAKPQQNKQNQPKNKTKRGGKR